MSLLGKILSLSYDSAAVTKTSALKTYYRSVRLIKETNHQNSSQPSYITNVLLCGNCIDSEKRNLYVFYIDTFARIHPVTGLPYNTAWIIEINIDTRVQTVVYYDKYNDIGLDPLFKIYNARVVHGRIVWTDNKNPIYQMDIERAKKSFALKIGYGQYPNTAEWSVIKPYPIDEIVSNGNRFYKNLSYNNLGIEPKLDGGTNWKDLCLIEDAYYSMNVENFYFEPVPPKLPPAVEYQADDSRKINNLRQTLFQFAYRYVYMDWRKSTFSPASIVSVPQAEEETATGLAYEQISLNNRLQIIVNTGGEEVRAIEIIGRSSADTSKWFLIDTIHKFEVQERGNEVSGTVEANYAEITITIPVPIVIGTNIVNAIQKQISIWIIWPAVINSYITASVGEMTWIADEFGDGAVKTVTVSCSQGSTIVSKPDWLTLLDSEGQLFWQDMNVSDGEVISAYPVDRSTTLRTGTIVLRSVYNDLFTINVTHLAPVVPPEEYLTPEILIDPLEESGLVLVAETASAAYNNNIIALEFTVNDPAHAMYESVILYWRCVVIRDAVQLTFGNGIFDGVLDEVSRIEAIVLSGNLIYGDVIFIYLSAQSVLETKPQRINSYLSIQRPYVVNSVVNIDKNGMAWLATQYGVEEKDTTTLTCAPPECVLTSKPSWIVVRGSEGYDYLEGWPIYNEEILSIFPNMINYGAERTGYIVFTNVWGDSKTIFVSQAASEDPPPEVPIECFVQLYAGDTSGLTIPGGSATAVSGDKHLHWSARVEHTSYYEGSVFSMYWRAKVNDVVQGSGSFETSIGEQIGEIVIDVTLLAGDIVLIDFSSVPI
jgi:hypothetical protein